MDPDDVFIREHTPFVNGIARQTRNQLGVECELDDLIAFGFKGLIEARARFDDTKGVPFKSFAYYRVRGGVLDGIRQMAYLPRRAYQRMRAAEALDAEAENVAETRAATPAMQTATGGLRAMDSALGRVAAAFCVAAGTEEEEDTDASPEQRLIQKQHRALTRDAIKSLPERERHLIHGHYIEGRRLDELAAELGLSKSWGSRLHSRALDLLREQLAAPVGDP